MAIKEFETALQQIRDSSGKAHPWYMRGKASIDDSGNISTVTHLESHIDLSGFTGGMYAEFIDSNGGILFQTPLLQYGVDGRKVPSFIGTPSPRTVNCSFKVDPSVFAQVDSCAIQLFHAPKNRLVEICKKILKFLEDILKIAGVDFSSSSASKDVSVLQQGLNGGSTVYALHDGGSTAGEIIATWNHSRSPSLTPSSKIVPVTVFEHSNYGGRSQSYEVGSHDLNRLTIGNDLISSVRVTNGYKVTLFEHAGFKGATRSYTSDMPSLPDFNDKTSSLIVEQIAVNNGSVTVYEHSNYEGRSQTFDVGSYDLIRLTIGNDIISSIRVAHGYKVTLFEHAGFKGATRTYTSNTASLPDFNDKTSSLIVEKVTVNNTVIDMTHAGTSGFSFGQSQDQLKRFQTFLAISNQTMAGADLKLRKIQGTTQSDVVVELYACSNHKPTGSALAAATIPAASVGTAWTVVNAPLSYPSLSSGSEYAVVTTQRTLSGQVLYEWATSPVSNTTYFGKWNGTSWIDESGLGDGWLKVWLR